LYDLHNHLLPGLDDGPSLIEESLAMARIAARDGIRVIVATPHLKDVLERSAEDQLTSKLAQLQELIGRERLGIQLKRGMEAVVDPGLPLRLKEGALHSLNGSRYVLVEFPPSLYPPFADDALFQIQLAGYTPIIAHPERHAPVQRNIELLAALVERGMLAQVTAGSYLGSFGRDAKRAAEALLKRNLVHIIASDAHAARGHRTPVLSQAFSAVSKMVGEAKALQMVNDTPKAIVSGQEVKVEPPLAAARKRIFGLW